MTIARADLDTTVEGDSLSSTLTFTDNLGNPWDITDWTVWFTVKEHASDNSPLLQGVNTTHTDPLNGITTFEFTPAETAGIVGVKAYDFQVEDDVGEITTVTVGRIRFIDGVTDDT